MNQLLNRPYVLHVFNEGIVDESVPNLQVVSLKCVLITVKPVLSGRSKVDKTKVLKTNGSLMKVESIAECSL